MQKKIRKLIRYSKDGVNVVGDINAAISTGESGRVTRTSTRSRNRIIQRGGKTWSESEIESPEDKEVNHGRGDS
jgi:hypothetical protein